MAKRSTLIILFVIILCSITILSGCNIAKRVSHVAEAAEILPFSTGETDDAATSEDALEMSVNARASETDIGKIIGEIYSEVCRGTCVADDDILKDVFLISPDDVLEYRVLYTTGVYGVQDVCIIKPAEGCKEAILEQLRQWKDNRTAFFEHYDVNNAYEIMKNAEIYTQGDYIIYLAVADMDAARASVDKYIPY